MTTTYFKTKEQYFQFRTNFAAATKNVKSKSTVVACDEWLSHEEKLSYDTGRSRIKGWLQAEHFIFLNIVRGLPIHHGFTPVTSKNKLTHGGNIWPGLDAGVRTLIAAARSAQKVKLLPQNSSQHNKFELYAGAAFRNFIEPLIGGNDFLNVIYMNILCSIEPILVEHKEYYTTFGIGVRIAKKMVEEDLKPKNYQEFMQIAEQFVKQEKVHKDAQQERLLQTA